MCAFVSSQAQQRCRTISSSYGDRFITERNLDACFLNLTSTKSKMAMSAASSPSHIARIAHATLLPHPADHLTLNPDHSIHHPPASSSPLATPLLAHPLQTSHHLPMGAQPTKRRKLVHMRPERVLEAPMIRGDNSGCAHLS